MVDLQGQYNTIKEEINNAVLQVIENATFINGPEVSSFKINFEKYLNVAHVIPCANGTDALQIALMGLGLQPGDEVISVAAGFPTTVNPILQFGAIPVFVDVESSAARTMRSDSSEPVAGKP